MRVGILGAGWIATSMATTLNGMTQANLYAVASRDIKKAEAFAEKYSKTDNRVISYGSYEDMLADENVDLVYVATPHSHHFEHMKMCIEYGKNILCEKAFTMNAAQAKEIWRLAQERGVFVEEAIWTRYMPSRKIINDLLDSGIIGEIRSASCSLSYSNMHMDRMTNPNLCGGALLDLGVYGLNFIVMHLGKDIERIDSTVIKADTGVDLREALCVVYKNGILATSNHAVDCRSDRCGVFYGSKGYVVVENINNPQSVKAYDLNDVLLKEAELPKQITGYEYEVLEAKHCIEEGLKESPSMPMDETVYMMEMMDNLRKEWGVKYPME